MSDHTPAPEPVTEYPERIPGYTYGTDKAATSPLSMQDLERLKQAVGLTPEDEHALRQAELVLEQMKLCLEAAGSALSNVLKCTVYCTSVSKFAAVNAVYARYFPADPPARVFVCVRPGQGPSTSRSTASPPYDCRGSQAACGWTTPTAPSLPGLPCSPPSTTTCRWNAWPRSA